MGVGPTGVEIYREIQEAEFSKQCELNIGAIDRAKVKKKAHTPKNHSDVFFSRRTLNYYNPIGERI